MINRKPNLDNLRIATPCPTSWETMKGDERTRFCDLCSLNVYNISEMTRTEAESLIANSEGRICARIYRRADGTVITRDCPVGLRAYRKRVAAYAGAALSMVLGLFSAGYSQQCKVQTDKNTVSASKLDITKKPNPGGESGLRGILMDENGAVIPNVEVLLFGKSAENPLSARSDSEGRYSFESLKPDKYILAIKATAGFKSMAVKDIDIEKGVTSELDVTLKLGDNVTVFVGAVGEAPLIDTTIPGGTTVITSDMIQRRP